MANYTILKNQIKDSIKTNGKGEITGQVLQDTLVNIVDTYATDLSSIEGNVKLNTDALYGEKDSFIESYDYNTMNVGQEYATKKGTNDVFAGHVYQIEISSDTEENTSLLRQYDTSNSSLVVTEIEGSRGTSNRTLTYYCEVDGKIACTILVLNAKTVCNVTIIDITDKGIVEIINKQSKTFGIENKNILVVGDSISTGSSSAQLSSINMPSYGKYEKWVDILIESGFFGRKTINCSQHATGFVAKQGSEDWINNSDFLSRVKYFVANGKIVPSSIDLIVVFGGINDFKLPCELGDFGEGDTSKFIPALEAFYEYLLETFPQARIVSCTPTRCAVFNGDVDWGTRTDWAEGTFIADQNSLLLTYDQYCQAIKDVAKKYSIPVIDLAYESGFVPLNKANRDKWSYIFDEGSEIPTDGIHPNFDFQKKILAPIIYGYLEKVYGLTL